VSHKPAAAESQPLTACCDHRAAVSSTTVAQFTMISHHHHIGYGVDDHWLSRPLGHLGCRGSAMLAAAVRFLLRYATRICVQHAYPQTGPLTRSLTVLHVDLCGMQACDWAANVPDRLGCGRG